MYTAIYIYILYIHQIFVNMRVYIYIYIYCVHLVYPEEIHTIAPPVKMTHPFSTKSKRSTLSYMTYVVG